MNWDDIFLKIKLFSYILIYLFLLSYGICLLYIDDDVAISVGSNLLVSVVLIVFSTFFIRYVLDYRRNKRWTMIKDRVYKSIGQEINFILNLLESMIYENRAVKTQGKGTREDINTKIIEKRKENITHMIDNYREITVKQEFLDSILCGELNDILEEIKTNLGNEELKYGNYLDVNTLFRIMDIQNAIKEIKDETSLPENIRSSKNIETQVREMLSAIHNIKNNKNLRINNQDK